MIAGRKNRPGRILQPCDKHNSKDESNRPMRYEISDDLDLFGRKVKGRVFSVQFSVFRQEKQFNGYN